MHPEFLWATAACALVTIALKSSFIEGSRHIRLPCWFREALEFVPPAVLIALVIPGVFNGQSGLELHSVQWRLIRGLWQRRGLRCLLGDPTHHADIGSRHGVSIRGVLAANLRQIHQRHDVGPCDHRSREHANQGAERDRENRG